MNGAKEHLDKIVAIVVIVACIGWVAKTHLEVKEEVVTNEQIDQAIVRLKGAARIPVELAPVENYADNFIRHMGDTEAMVNSDLVSWKYFPMPDSGPVPTEKWELEAVFENAAAAEVGADKLRKAGVKRVKALGRRLRVEGFVSKLDPTIEALSRQCKAAGAKSTDIVEKGVVPGVGYASLGQPSISVAGVMVGKAVLSGSLGSAADKFCECTVVQVWKKKASAGQWPSKAMVTITAIGEKVSVSPAGSAVVTGDAFQITETKLPAREVFEYRVRKVACFVKEVRKGEAAVEVLPPKAAAGVDRNAALDGLLGKQKVAYATTFSEAVKVETPGEVQIQYAGSGGFRLRRKVAGLNEPVSTYRMFKAGERIKHFKDKRVRVGDNKTVLRRFRIDAEVNLVAMTTEKRRLLVRKFVFEKDPETGATVQKVKMVPGPEVDVQVAVIEDVRSGKKHRLDKARGRNSGWWPGNAAIQAEPGKTAPGSETAPPPDRRRVSTRSRREPVTPKPVTPKPVTPKPVTPKPVTPKPVVRRPVRPKPVTPKPVARQPEAVVRPGPLPGEGIQDPGPAPATSGTSNEEERAAYDAWKARKREYEDFVRSQKEGQRN